MMRVAVISDSHGNRVALEAVLDDLDSAGPYDAVIVAGDIAYGGPDPAGCIDLVRDRGYPAVRGNTEEMVLSAVDDPAGADANARWVASMLGSERLAYMSTLPIQHLVETDDYPDLAIVHATPWSVWPAVHESADEETVKSLLDASGAKALAYGHIHLQYQRELNGRRLIAVGAVGLPFDGMPVPMYTVLTSDGTTWEAEFRRVEYDLNRAVAEAEQAEYPNAENFIRLLQSARPPR